MLHCACIPHMCAFTIASFSLLPLSPIQDYYNNCTTLPATPVAYSLASAGPAGGTSRWFTVSVVWGPTRIATFVDGVQVRGPLVRMCRGSSVGPWYESSCASRPCGTAPGSFLLTPRLPLARTSLAHHRPLPLAPASGTRAGPARRSCRTRRTTEHSTWVRVCMELQGLRRGVRG